MKGISNMVFRVSVVLGLLILLLCAGVQGAYADYWQNAQETHNFVVGNLLSPYDSYYVSPSETNTSYEWYDASQIHADSFMVRRGDTRYLPYMNNTFYNYMFYLWDSGDPAGGYFAGSSPDGSGVYQPHKYVDDNSLTGVAYLDCYDVTTGGDQASYLASAQAVANWLMYSGLRDGTYGGGFWWNTDMTLKPTQSNGLAAQVFIRLWDITGQSYYKSWADSILAWLEGTMKDTADGCFCWKYEGGVRDATKFAYDQGIMIDLYLDYYYATGSSTYRTKANTLAGKMNTKLWNNTYGVYKSHSATTVIYPVYSVWPSQSLVRLYQANGNSTWLTYAQRNIDYMNTYLRDGNNLGYYSQCNIDGSGRSNYQSGVDQAWMQRTQAVLSQYR